MNQSLSLQYALSQLTEQERETYETFTKIQYRMSDRLSEIGGLEAVFSQGALEPYFNVMQRISGLKKDYYMINQSGCNVRIKGR